MPGLSRDYYVYIMSNDRGTMYIGITNDLERRLAEHRTGLIDGFTRQYKLTKLVYFETASEVRDAIAREKQIKGWGRSKKLALVWSVNPNWRDLSEDWGTEDSSRRSE